MDQFVHTNRASIVSDRDDYRWSGFINSPKAWEMLETRAGCVSCQVLNILIYV